MARLDAWRLAGLLAEKPAGSPFVYADHVVGGPWGPGEPQEANALLRRGLTLRGALPPETSLAPRVTDSFMVALLVTRRLATSSSIKSGRLGHIAQCARGRPIAAERMI